MQIHYGFDSEKAAEFPSMVQLTITTVCDMSCGHCPHSSFRKEYGYKPSMMSLDLYKKVADEVGQHPEATLRIFGWGEPLLHPDLPTMIEYAKGHGVGLVNLITNGLALNEARSAQLVQAGLDVLEVSIDAVTAQTYAAVRGVEKNLGRVEQNVMDYIRQRDVLHGHTYVCVSIINQPKAKPELNAFVEKWTPIVDDVIVRPFHDFMGYAADREQIVLPPRHPCRCLWSRFNVNSEGLVSVCFNDWHNQTIIGNMNDSTIAEIWKNDVYAKLRESHLQGTPKGICATCNDWIGASWEFPYEVLTRRAREKIGARKGDKV
jgi:radical SAM protein with 4Fe4S-binding SPASM domain